jgi:ribosomal protein L13E
MKIRINKPITKHKIRGTKLSRSGIGFSTSELKEAAGVTNIRMTKNKVIRIDLLRKTKTQKTLSN